MNSYATEFPIKKMSEVLGVSRSGFYKWQARQSLDIEHGEREKANKLIAYVYQESRSTYGSPRIWEELSKSSIEISRSTIARRMQQMNLKARVKRKYVYTTDSNHTKRISPNLLERDFTARNIGQKWVSDITYIAVNKGFVYLTTVIDLADRMVVGWSLSQTMTDIETTLAAFNQAIKFRPVKSGLIFHSDRGSQYASDDFRNLLDHYECKQSMSRKGNCWDNAVAESFFKTIKVESLYNHKFENIHDVRSVLFDYIDGWYNTKRIHSTLDGLSPLQKAIEIMAA